MNIISVTIHCNQPLPSYLFFFNSNNDCIRPFPLLVFPISALNYSARVSLFTVLFEFMADIVWRAVGGVGLGMWGDVEGPGCSIGRSRG